VVNKEPGRTLDYEPRFMLGYDGTSAMEFGDVEGHGLGAGRGTSNLG